jgi:hypothetical protein
MSTSRNPLIYLATRAATLSGEVLTVEENTSVYFHLNGEFASAGIVLDRSDAVALQQFLYDNFVRGGT